MKYIITFLLLALCAQPLFGEKLEISADETALNMRAEASPKAKKVGIILKGVQYEVVGKAASYYKVRATDKVTGKEVTGWVWVNQVAEEKGADLFYIKKPGVALRAGPSRKTKILGGLHSGSRIHEILKRHYIWYQVKVDGKVGWVGASYCKIVKEAK